MSEYEPPTGHIAPDPITPQSTPDQANDRVAWENEVNAGAEAFAADAFAAYIDAAVKGGTVGIVTEGVPAESDAPDSDIAPETALAAAADAGLIPYSEWSKDELADECRNRELAVSGTKDELIERLEASDAEDVAAES